jgi:hypothetical protein
MMTKLQCLEQSEVARDAGVRSKDPYTRKTFETIARQWDWLAERRLASETLEPQQESQ